MPPSSSSSRSTFRSHRSSWASSFVSIKLVGFLPSKIRPLLPSTLQHSREPDVREDDDEESSIEARAEALEPNGKFGGQHDEGTLAFTSLSARESDLCHTIDGGSAHFRRNGGEQKYYREPHATTYDKPRIHACIKPSNHQDISRFLLPLRVELPAKSPDSATEINPAGSSATVSLSSRTDITDLSDNDVSRRGFVNFSRPFRVVTGAPPMTLEGTDIKVVSAPRFTPMLIERHTTPVRSTSTMTANQELSKSTRNDLAVRQCRSIGSLTVGTTDLMTPQSVYRDPPVLDEVDVVHFRKLLEKEGKRPRVPVWHPKTAEERSLDPRYWLPRFSDMADVAVKDGALRRPGAPFADQVEGRFKYFKTAEGYKSLSDRGKVIAEIRQLHRFARGETETYEGFSRPRPPKDSKKSPLRRLLRRTLKRRNS